jgi:hypothetical protein
MALCHPVGNLKGLSGQVPYVTLCECPDDRKVVSLWHRLVILQLHLSCSPETTK